MTEKPVTTGVSNASDTLPERADMPRIMDERDIESSATWRMLPQEYQGHCREVGCHNVARFHDADGVYRCNVHTEQRDGSQVTR